MGEGKTELNKPIIRRTPLESFFISATGGTIVSLLLPREYFESTANILTNSLGLAMGPQFKKYSPLDSRITNFVAGCAGGVAGQFLSQVIRDYLN